MSNYNNLNHCRWECKYHFVFTPKYRKKTLFGFIRKELKEVRKEWEENPVVKVNGLTTIKKSTKFILIGFTVIFFLILIISSIWFNVNLSKLASSDFSSNININGDTTNITLPLNTTTNINNEHIINVYNNNTILFPKEFVDFMEAFNVSS